MRLRLLMLTVLLCGAALATTLEPMSIERLTRASSDVVIAQAEDSWTEWNADQTLIYTITRFRVQRALKGGSAETVLVKQMGGSMGGIEQKVSGVRPWRSGERAVLFLRPSRERANALAVTGLVQGDFRFVRRGSSEFVSNGVPGVESLDRSTRRLSVYTGKRMTLADLESEVKRAVGK